MKKILIVTDQINYGGVAKSLCDMLRVLEVENYQIVVACIYGDMTPIADIGVKSNIEFINLTGDYREIVKPVNFLKYFYKFRKNEYWVKLYENKIGKTNYDVEIAFGAPLPFFFISASSNIRSKKIGWLHSSADKINWIIHNKKLFLNSLKLFSSYIVVSKKLEDSFVKLFHVEHTQVIHNILDVCHVRMLSNLYSVVRGERFTLVFAGRLERVKRVDRLLESLKKVMDETGKELDLVIVGTGSQQKKLKSITVKLGLSGNVRFEGYKENPFPFMKSADLFVLPSDYEGFGLVVGESLALGVPVIATDVEGPVEILGKNGKYGLLCEPTVQSLADSMKMVIVNDELYGKMRDNIADFEWPNKEIAQKIYNILELEDQPSTISGVICARSKMNKVQSGLVSVVMPTWNRAHTIQNAINSVLAQTYKNIELLICDDGSTDNTRQIISSINDSRIRYIYGLHSGLPAIPRNRGMSESRGEWIAFLDSDDCWRADKLEKQLDCADKNHALAVCSNAIRFVPNYGEKDNFIYWKKPEILFRNILAGNLVINSSVILHSSLMGKLSGFPEEVHLKAIEDYALWLRVLTQTNFYFINEPLVIYRDEPLTSVRKKQINIFEIKRKLFDNFINWAEKNNVDKKFAMATRWWFVCRLSDFPCILINAFKKYSR